MDRQQLAEKLAALGGPGALLALLVRGRPITVALLLVVAGALVGLAATVAWGYVAPYAYVAF